MKINLTEKIAGCVRKSSRTSRILFILCAILGILTLVSDMDEVLFLATGFMGVMWLSSIAMHSFRNGRTGKSNPFTILVAACTAVSVVCLLTSALWRPVYRENEEPLELATRGIQSSLECLKDDTGTLIEDRILCADSAHLNPAEHNAILTDREGNVLFTVNSWQWNGGDTLYALTCPATYTNGSGLMILTDGEGNVISSLLADQGWTGSDGSSAGVSGLTIEAENTAPKPAAAKTGKEKVYQRYFPSFGTMIDKSAIQLVYANMSCESDGPRVTDHVRESGPYTVQTWNGEKIIDIDYDGSPTEEQALIVELNELTETERAGLKKYLQWLDSALYTARNPQGDYISNRVRVITGPNEDLTVYLLYRDDSACLYPVRDAYYDALHTQTHIFNAGILMIPAVIVFLAFWVFVDAKKRGQSSPALWAVLTLIGNVIAWLVYMLVRPQMMKTAAGQSMPKGACPICGAKLRNDFIACPGCGILLRSRCKNCGKALENDWSFCPYCTQAVSVAPLPATAAEAASAPVSAAPTTDHPSHDDSQSDVQES